MVMLICEGRCNPGVRQLDVEVFQERKAMKGEKGPLTDLRLIGRLGQLQHTAHTQVREHFYACLTCAHERRFGGNMSLAESFGR